jgi:phage shock protein A
MSIFKRVENITMATLHEVLDRVEDPVAMLNQYMRDMESEISRAEVSIARQVAMEKKWSLLMGETQERMEKRSRQAELAVDMGEEEVARRALEDKQMCEVKIEEYRNNHQMAKQQTSMLREQLQELKEKFYEMRNKKAALLARANVARTSRQMNVVMNSIDTESAAKGFARMEEKILMMEADAEASQYMRAHYSSAMPAGYNPNPRVEEELSRLKEARKKPSQTENSATKLPEK